MGRGTLNNHLNSYEFEAKGKSYGFFCGGSIIDLNHVLTAAHCLFNPATKQMLPATAFVVVVGASAITEAGIKSAGVEARAVTGVRAHPYFDYAEGPGTPDDVGVLALAKPLNASSYVQSIPLVGSGSTPAEGTAVEIAGFGAQSESELNEYLYSLGMTLGFPRECGGEADAVFLCAGAPTGSACVFDEGGGLGTGPPATLVGVLSTYENSSGELCRAGTVNGFTNLAAPEIRDFVEGDESPPKAPRGGAGLEVAGVPTVGQALTCTPGSWSGEPTFTYSFIDSTEGAVLQTGSSPTYELTAADVGRTIRCRVQAANAGGTGVAQTTALPAIKAPPPIFKPEPKQEPKQEPKPSPEGGGSGSPTPPQPIARAAREEVTLAGERVTVSAGGVALVRLACSGGIEECSGKLTLTAKDTAAKGAKRHARTVTIGTAKFTIAPAETTAVKIDLNSTGRALLHADHGKLAAALTILELAPEANGPRTDSVRLVMSSKTRKARKRRK